jgi:hypothetical protein
MDRKAEALERLYRERYARFWDGLAPVNGSYDTATATATRLRASLCRSQ